MEFIVDRLQKMTVAIVEILVQFFVCCLLLDHSETKDVMNLTMCCKMFSSTRKKLLCDKFTLILCKKEDYEKCISMGARRVNLRMGETDWIKNYPFNFLQKEKNLLVFHCAPFNKPLISFGSLTHFDCLFFDQPVASFDNLTYFRSRLFNQRVKSFGKLLHFECWDFNQPITSFGFLEHFECYHFNQPVLSFGSLKHFESWHFNQPLASFGEILHFECAMFNQTVASFNSLEKFICWNFSQKIDSFGNLKKFKCSADIEETIIKWQRRMQI
jgi:hypothetical protein